MTSHPRLWDIFKTFFGTGVQSFGGGTSTLYLIHQASVSNGWLTEEEFLRAWALVQISPGINLVKLTILIGYALRGWPGLTVALLGMLLPSAAITVLMTAGFTLVSSISAVKSAMKGILPATVGLSLAMAIQMAQPLLVNAHREGKPRMAVHLGILACAALVMGALGASPVLALGLAGALGILLLWLIPASPMPVPPLGDEKGSAV